MTKTSQRRFFLIQFGQTLRLIFGYQGINNFTQGIAGDNIVKLIQGQVNPVVGYSPLRVIIGANPLAAVAAADLQFALFGVGRIDAFFLLVI